MITTKSYRRRGSDEEINKSSVKDPKMKPEAEIKEIIPSKSPLGESSTSTHLPNPGKNNKKVFSYFWQNLFKHRKVEKEKKNVNVVKVGSNSSLYENGRFYSSSSSESVNTILSTNSFSFVNPAGKRQRGKRIPIEDLSNSAVNPNLRKKVSTLTRLGIRMGLKSKYNLQSCESLQHLQYIDATNPRRTPLMGRSRLEHSKSQTIDPIATAASELTTQIQTFHTNSNERIREKTVNGTIIIHDKEKEEKMNKAGEHIEKITEKDRNGMIAEQKIIAQSSCGKMPLKDVNNEKNDQDERIIERDSQRANVKNNPKKFIQSIENSKIEQNEKIFEKDKQSQRIPIQNEKRREIQSETPREVQSEKRRQKHPELQITVMEPEIRDSGRVIEMNLKEGSTTLGQKKRKAPRIPPTNSLLFLEGHRRCMSEGNSHSEDSLKKLHVRGKRKAPIPPGESFSPPSPHPSLSHQRHEGHQSHQNGSISKLSSSSPNAKSSFSYPHFLNPFSSDEEEEEVKAAISVETKPSSSTPNYNDNYNNENIPGPSRFNYELKSNVEIVAIKPLNNSRLKPENCKEVQNVKSDVKIPEQVKSEVKKSEVIKPKVKKVIDEEEAQNLLNDQREEEKRRNEPSRSSMTQIKEETRKTFESLLKATSAQQQQKEKDKELKAQLIQLKKEAEKSPYFYLKNPFTSSTKCSQSSKNSQNGLPGTSPTSLSSSSTMNSQTDKNIEVKDSPINETPPVIPIYEDFLVGKLNPKPWYKRSAFGKSKTTTKSPTVKILPKFSDLDKEATRIVEENRRRSAAEGDYNETANDLITMFSAFNNPQIPQNQNPFESSDSQTGNSQKSLSTFANPKSITEIKKVEIKNKTDIKSETKKPIEIKGEVQGRETEQISPIESAPSTSSTSVSSSSSKSKLTPNEVSLLVTNHLRQKSQPEIEFVFPPVVNCNKEKVSPSTSSSSSQLSPLSKFNGSLNESTREAKKLAIVQPQSPRIERTSSTIKDTQLSSMVNLRGVGLSKESSNSDLQSIWSCPRCTLNNPQWRALCDACYYRNDTGNDTMQKLNSIFEQINAEFKDQNAAEELQKQEKAKAETKTITEKHLEKSKNVPELYENFLSQLPSKENLAKEEKLNGMKLDNSEVDEAEEINLAKLRQIRLAFFTKNNTKIFNEKQNNLTCSTQDENYEDVNDVIEEITTVKNIVDELKVDDDDDKTLDSLLQLQLHPQVKIDSGPRSWKPLHLTKFRPMLSSILESVDQNMNVLQRHKRRSFIGENVEPPVYENCQFENGNWTDTFMQFHNKMQNTFETLISDQADVYVTSNSSSSSTDDQTMEGSKSGNEKMETRKLTREDYKKLGAIPKSFVDEPSNNESYDNESRRSSSSSFKGEESREKKLSGNAKKLLRKLEWAIGEGDHRMASRLARDLALLRVNCVVAKPNEPFIIRVYVEDRFMQQGPFQVQVSSTMRVKELKSKIESDWGIPFIFQKWILGRKMAENDNEELYSFSISPDSMAFLYIVSPEEEIKSTLEKAKLEKSKKESEERKSLNKEANKYESKNEPNLLFGLNDPKKEDRKLNSIPQVTNSSKNSEDKIDVKQIFSKPQSKNPSISDCEKASPFSKKESESQNIMVSGEGKNLNLEIKVPVQMIQESFRIKDDEIVNKNNPENKPKDEPKPLIQNPIKIPDIGTQTQKVNSKTATKKENYVEVKNSPSLSTRENYAEITTQKIIVCGVELSKKVSTVPLIKEKPKDQMLTMSPKINQSLITSSNNAQNTSGIILPTTSIAKVPQKQSKSLINESKAPIIKDISPSKDTSNKMKEQPVVQCKPIVPKIIRMISLSPPLSSPQFPPKETLSKPSEIVVTQPKVIEIPPELKTSKTTKQSPNLIETKLCQIEPPKRKKKIQNIPVTKVDQGTETDKILTVHTITKSKNESTESPKVETDEVYYDAEIYQPVQFISDEVPSVSPTPSFASTTSNPTVVGTQTEPGPQEEQENVKVQKNVKVEIEVQTDIVGEQFQAILNPRVEDQKKIPEVPVPTSKGLEIDDKINETAEVKPFNISTSEEKVSNVETYMKMLQMMEKEDLIGNVEEFECPICFNITLTGDGALLRECLHSFCKECLVFAVQYAEEPVVKCPYMDSNYSCNSSLLEREIKALVPSDIFEKHLARSVKIAESKMLNTFHCKTNDCKGWCVFEDDVNYFNCPVCSKRNCLTCQAIHEGKNCQEFQRELAIAAETDEDAKSSRLMLEKMIQRGEALDCPACHVVLLKKWGCDWVRCSYCKTEICWVTKGFRWGPQGKGDTTGGCKCGVNGIRCHPKCTYCH